MTVTSTLPRSPVSAVSWRSQQTLPSASCRLPSRTRGQASRGRTVTEDRPGRSPSVPRCSCPASRDTRRRSRNQWPRSGPCATCWRRGPHTRAAHSSVSSSLRLPGKPLSTSLCFFPFPVLSQPSSSPNRHPAQKVSFPPRTLTTQRQGRPPPPNVPVGRTPARLPAARPQYPMDVLQLKPASLLASPPSRCWFTPRSVSSPTSPRTEAQSRPGAPPCATVGSRRPCQSLPATGPSNAPSRLPGV